MTNLVFAGAGHVFPSVVRRFNLIRPARWSYAGETIGVNVRNWANADYFKDWLPYNLQNNIPAGTDTDTAQFGAFTTAPDGTTDTARLLVETATNTEHSFIAGMPNSNVMTGRVRFAGVFKYYGRRIVMTIVAGGGGVAYFGCKAVFDLLHGTVAIANATFGTFTPNFGSPVEHPMPWKLFPAQIEPVGKGWYLCSIEAMPSWGVVGSVQGIFCKLSLDSGTSDTPEKSTYLGNGVSGVYAWRSNMLPARAWDLSTVTFFDDFDDPGTIDFENTKAPGYNWYVSNPWPGWDAGLPETPSHDTPPPGSITVADSILYTNHNVRDLGSASSTWVRPATEVADRAYTSGYVGRVFSRPALFECRAKWTTPSSPAYGIAYWGTTLEWLLVPKHGPPENWIEGMEMDWLEAWTAHRLPVSHVHFKYLSPTDSNDMPYVAGLGPNLYTTIDTWFAAVDYYEGNSVERLGVNYTALAFTANEPPETTPLKWGPYTNPVPSVIPPSARTDQFNVYAGMTFLWTSEEPGQYYVFFNGGFASVPLIYGASLHGNHSDEFYHVDYQSQPLFIGAAHPDTNAAFDWIRVTQ